MLGCVCRVIWLTSGLRRSCSLCAPSSSSCLSGIATLRMARRSKAFPIPTRAAPAYGLPHLRVGKSRSTGSSRLVGDMRGRNGKIGCLRKKGATMRYCSRPDPAFILKVSTSKLAFSTLARPSNPNTLRPNLPPHHHTHNSVPPLLRSLSPQRSLPHPARPPPPPTPNPSSPPTPPLSLLRVPQPATRLARLHRVPALHAPPRRYPALAKLDLARMAQGEQIGSNW